MWETLNAATASNRKRDDQLVVASDLTTVVQLGDVLIVHLLRSSDALRIRFAELKVGRVNRVIYEDLLSRGEEPLDDLTDRLRRKLGDTAVPHVRRMAKQLQRLKDFDRVVASGEGRHPVLGTPLRLLPDRLRAKDYRDKLAALISRAKAQGSAAVLIDQCLGLFAVAADQQPANAAIAHSFYHLLNPDACCRLNEPDAKSEILAINNSPRAVDLVDFNMRSSLALPPLVWYPVDAMIDAVLGRVRIYARFDLEQFFRMAHTRGLTMTLIRGKAAEQIKQAKMSGPLIGYPGVRGVKVEREGKKTVALGSRFFARVYWDLIRPSDLLAMAERFVDEICRRESDSGEASP